MTIGRQPQRNVVPRACAVCGTTFTPYRLGFITCSKPCYRKLPHVAARDKAHKGSAEVRERRNRVRRVGVNPERREVNFRSAIARYGLTPERYDALFEGQGGRCAICGEKANPEGVRAASRLHIDHDHVSGRVRALLCNNCNRGLGYFMDNARLLQAAAQYLQLHAAD